MKRLIVDLDGTITREDAGTPYSQKRINEGVVERLREYRANGFEIAILTARNMNTFSGNIGKINARTLPVIIDWLDRHKVPYDEVHVGKPWCGTEGFYIDDRAVRPREFASLSYDELARLLKSGESSE